MEKIHPPPLGFAAAGGRRRGTTDVGSVGWEHHEELDGARSWPLGHTNDRQKLHVLWWSLDSTCARLKKVRVTQGCPRSQPRPHLRAPDKATSATAVPRLSQDISIPKRDTNHRATDAIKSAARQRCKTTGSKTINLENGWKFTEKSIGKLDDCRRRHVAETLEAKPSSVQVRSCW
jgi:hypothetical protein